MNDIAPLSVLIELTEKIKSLINEDVENNNLSDIQITAILAIVEQSYVGQGSPHPDYPNHVS